MDSNCFSWTQNRRNPNKARRLCLLIGVPCCHYFNAILQSAGPFNANLLLLFIALITFLKTGSYLLRHVESFTRSFLNFLYSLIDSSQLISVSLETEWAILKQVLKSNFWPGSLFARQQGWNQAGLHQENEKIDWEALPQPNISFREILFMFYILSE